MQEYSPYNDNRPEKAAIHKCLNHAPMSMLAASLIQEIATWSDGCVELLGYYRDGVIDQHLPAFPGQSAWIELYRDHRSITEDIDLGLQGMISSAPGEMQGILDETRALSTLARERPSLITRAMRRCGTNRKWWKFFSHKYRVAYREYLANVNRLVKEIQRPSDSSDDATDFDQLLSTRRGVYFYMRVVLPMVCIFHTTPQREIARLRRATEITEQNTAVERLSAIDPWIASHPDVYGWLNCDDGRLRSARQGLIDKARRKGLKQGRPSPTQVKAFLGALIQSVVEQAGSYFDLVHPGLQPAKIEPHQVKALFDAVAKDRMGRGRVASLQVDADIAELQQGSWAQQLSRKKRLTDQLLKDPGRLKTD